MGKSERTCRLGPGAPNRRDGPRAALDSGLSPGATACSGSRARTPPW
jgi:hypothetical protein